MKILETKLLAETQKEKVHGLWNNEYPEKLKHETLADQDNYFKNLENLNHLLLSSEENEIVGWAFSFQRNSENWFAIILHHKIKNMGHGSMLLDELKKKFTELNGWVIDHDNDKKQNGESYLSPLKFYLKNNFNVWASVRLETEKISAVKIQWLK